MVNEMHTIAQFNLLMAGLFDEFGIFAAENFMQNYPLLRRIAAGENCSLPETATSVQEEFVITPYPENFNYTLVSHITGQVMVNDLELIGQTGRMFIVLWENFGKIVTYEDLFIKLRPSLCQKTRRTHAISGIKSRLHYQLLSIGLQIVTKFGRGYILEEAKN